MPYSRQRPRVPAAGRVTVRLTVEQRDLLLQSVETPKNLAHALHRAPVRQGKLALGVRREELDSLISAAAGTRVPDRDEERRLGTFLRYLEMLEERFEEPEASDAAEGAEESSRES